jgi:hypothetical protein
VLHDLELHDLELDSLTTRSYKDTVLIEANEGEYAGWAELGRIDADSLYRWLGEWLGR